MPLDNLHHPNHPQLPDLGLTGLRLMRLLHQEAAADLVQGISQQEMADVCGTTPHVIRGYLVVLQHLSWVLGARPPAKKGSPGGQPNVYQLNCCRGCTPQLRLVES